MSAKEKISRARSDFLMERAFLGDLAIRLIVRQETNCPTMATDAKHLFYGEKFVESLSHPHLCGVIAHEIGHVLFGHAGPAGIERAKQFRSDIWTVACEYMANHFVIDICKLTLPGEYIYDHKYDDGTWTTEMIARDIDQKTIKIDMLLSQILDDHSQWGKDKANNGHQASPTDSGDIDADWKVWIAQALHNAKRQGNLPAALSRMIEDVLEPKLPWQAILAEFVLQRSKDDYSWRRPNKRYMHRGIYSPALSSEKIRISYAIDTSGSMGIKELQEGLAELRAICSSFPSYEIHLFSCDAKIHDYEILELGDDPDIAALCRGGGGTDFRPVFNYIKEHNIQIDCLIYFTDGEGTFPEEPPDYPVLWVISGKAEVPWGRRCEL